MTVQLQKNLLTHENPTHPIASDSMSASIDGYELPAGKYAWNCGCCQCVIWNNRKQCCECDIYDI